MGKYLNPFVSAMHNDANNEIKFRVPKKIYDVRRNHRRTSVVERVPVVNPLESPEAFDGRYVLQHMHSVSAFRIYAETLGTTPSEFKKMIKQILGRIPRRRNPSFTWQLLFDTFYLMRNFIEKVADGLESSTKSNLVAGLYIAMHELDAITVKAEQARQLLSCFP